MSREPTGTPNQGYTYRERIGPEWAGQRLLAYLTARHPHSDADTWAARLRRGELWLNGLPARGDERLSPGQRLTWQRPPWVEEAVPLHYDLVLEDAWLLAVNKPSGLPTLPGGGFLEHTLLSLVRRDFPAATPLHRLGRATSGLLLFGRTRAATSALSAAWRGGAVEKRYRALVQGVPAWDALDIETPIGPVPHARLGTVYAASATGKPALSRARVLERRKGSALLEVEIPTGRPHQIRIHLASVGHPLAGDPLYGVGGLPLPERPGLPGDGGYHLHAARLTFVHPLTGELLDLHAPPPPMLRTAGEG